MTESVCGVCMESVSVADSCTLPGCGHQYHCACLINFVQYDVRCPVCRQLPEGVAVRDQQTLSTHLRGSLEDLRIAQRYWQRYVARRQRFVRGRPQLQKAYSDLRHLRRQINTKIGVAQRVYDRKCRTVWRTDPEVCNHKRELINMRRRERRLENIIRLQLEEIGPEPL